MPYKINSLNAIKSRLGIDLNGEATKFLVSTCRKHMDKYVPRRTGNLRRNVIETQNSIIYKSPYAHYLYKGEKYVDPETGKSAFFSEDYGYWSRKNVKKIPSGEQLNIRDGYPYWDKRMISAEINDVCKEVERHIRRK